MPVTACGHGQCFFAIGDAYWARARAILVVWCHNPQQKGFWDRRVHPTTLYTTQGPELTELFHEIMRFPSAA